MRNLTCNECLSKLGTFCYDRSRSCRSWKLLEQLRFTARSLAQRVHYLYALLACGRVSSNTQQTSTAAHNCRDTNLAKLYFKMPELNDEQYMEHIKATNPSARESRLIAIIQHMRIHGGSFSGDEQKALRAAAKEALAIPELLESILAELPMRDLLLYQRVSRAWKDSIAGSRKLRQQLYLVPAHSESVFYRAGIRLQPESKTPQHLKAVRDRVTDIGS